MSANDPNRVDSSRCARHRAQAATDLWSAARSRAGEPVIDMNIEAEATDDNVQLALLQAVQTLQKDQLSVLEILGKLVRGMEALDQRLRKLEDDHAREANVQGS